MRNTADIIITYHLFVCGKTHDKSKNNCEIHGNIDIEIVISHHPSALIQRCYKRSSNSRHSVLRRPWRSAMKATTEWNKIFFFFFAPAGCQWDSSYTTSVWKRTHNCTGAKISLHMVFKVATQSCRTCYSGTRCTGSIRSTTQWEWKHRKSSFRPDRQTSLLACARPRSAVLTQPSAPRRAVGS